MIIAFNSIAQENSTFTDLRDGKVYKTIETGGIYKNYNKKTDGFSVRCIKD